MNLPKNQFCGCNLCRLPSFLYHKNLIFAEVIFTNLQEIVESAKFTALEKKTPYGIDYNKVLRFVHEYNDMVKIELSTSIHIFL